MNRAVKTLTAVFSSAFLGGCATTLPRLNLDTCMEATHSGSPFLFMVSKTEFSEGCSTAQAAALIAQIKRPDGAPDPAAQALVLELYRESNPQMRKYIDQQLERYEMSVSDLESEEESPVTCTVAEDTPTTLTFICRPTLSR